jgi:ubiquitin-like modifier-activating enzyme ATG7
MPSMQYVPFASDIEIPFYASLASHKINHDKLDDSARKLMGLYEIRPSDAKENSCRMQIHGNALTNDDTPAGYYRAEGLIKNTNTIEDYRNLDKVQMLQQAGRTIWDAIKDGSIYSCPSLLASFLVLSYADLKKYRFSYWFAFPALVMEPSWVPVSESSTTTEGIPHKTLNSVESTALVDRVQTWRYAVDSRQHGFFLAKKSRRPQSRPARDPEEDEFPTTPETPLTPGSNLGYTWQIGSLSSYETGFFEGEYSDDCFVCFADPSNYMSDPGPIAPAWMLRNLLVLVRQRWNRDRIQVLCYRETQVRRDAARSIILEMEVSRQPTKKIARSGEEEQPKDPSDPTYMPRVVGWERNSHGKLAGRMVDLTEYMDPKKLADSSVDLNLKLMKWRISPNLNLDKIKETKCLLLGAGTLGSYVSRNLLGWGVRKITFVDNGSVSFSNPVRQPLFNFADCLEGGKKKALCAAEALKEIYPGVDSEGHVLSVPMAGHPVTDATRTKAEFEKLKELIDAHDVIFLLMDTRESRWLPTVMGKSSNKIVVNAALGFDTYVVMRHGVRPQAKQKPPMTSNEIGEGMIHSQPPDITGPKQSEELGCYFCNDVVAPSDSMKDLTLDQQCTVTRPGIAAIASALLVELLVSVLQHPDGASAPASLSSTEDRGEHPLGLIPHQIRGFLSNFTNLNITGKAYDCCSACSDKVLNAYESEGWEFVQKAMNERDYVEELSGLKEVHRQAEEAAKAMEAMELSDDEIGDIDEEGEMI